MTEQSNADLIAEVRGIDFEWVLDNSPDDSVEVIRELAAALEAADQRAEEAERERDNWKLSAEEAERAEKRLAAVVEKVREADKASSSWDHFGHLVMGILATAPADLLRELKADAWGEGSETGFTHGMSYQAGNNSAMNYRNPYRKEQS